MVEFFSLANIYMFCFWLGLGFTLVSLIFTGISEFSDLDFDSSDSVDYSLSSNDGGAVPESVSSSDHAGSDIAIGDNFNMIAPISPLTISTFITSFGATGMIWENFTSGWFWAFGILAAGLSGLIIAIIVFYLFYKIFLVTQSSSEITMDNILGCDAAVTEAIGASSVGQISFVARGRTQVALARHDTGKSVPRHSKVTIVAYDNATNIWIVDDHIDTKLEKLEAEELNSTNTLTDIPKED